VIHTAHYCILMQAGLAMNKSFEVLGKNNTTRARPPRARGPCNMTRELVQEVK
jgi:hypothetical protein